MLPAAWRGRPQLAEPRAEDVREEPASPDQNGHTHAVGGPAGLVPVRRPSIRRDIEGLRAVAVILVVLYHANLGVHGGYVGVDVFFVISGFLITRQLLGELARAGTVSLPRFYARRIKRLLPASATVAVATLIGSLLWISPLRLGTIVRDVIATSFYVINYRLAVQGTNYLSSTAPPSPLQHYWSLAVEEQYYLIWPVLLLLIAVFWARRKRRSGAAGPPPIALLGGVLGVIFVLSLALSVWLTHKSAPWAYFSLPSRAWELAAGALVAVYAEHLTRLKTSVTAVASWAGLALIAWSALAFNDLTPFPGIAAAAPVGGAALVIAAGCAGPRFGVEWVLRASPFQLGGRISYSWYLWHWPLLILVPAALGRPLHTKTAIAIIGLSFVLAWLTFHLIENPIRHQEVLSRIPRLGLGLGAVLSCSTALLAVIVIAVVPGASGSGSPQSVPSSSAAGFDQQISGIVGNAVSTRVVPSNLTPALETVGGDQPAVGGCHLSFSATKSGSCVFGDASSSTTVVLFGDSHAEQWFPALQTIAVAKHWKLVSLTKSDCPAVDVTMYSRVLKRTYTECDTWRANTLKQIAALHPKMVVMSSAITLTNVVNSGGAKFEAAWLAGTTSIVQTVKSTGAAVVWIGDTPQPKGNAPDCVASNLKDVRTCMNTAAAAEPDPARRTQSLQVAATAGATVVDPTPWSCPGTVCPVVVGNLLVYRDDSHLSSAYINWLGPLLEAKLPLS
jgi:peptidoglycan/LPS O-acetylase OafA/YrhL